MRNAYPGFVKTFGHRLGAGLADELLDRWFPPQPTFLQQMAKDALHALVSAAPYIVEAINKRPNAHGQEHTAVSPEAVDEVLRTNPPCPVPVPGVPGAVHVAGKTLGRFTCPKCGGWTWSTMGSDENGTYERYCTNGLRGITGQVEPNTVKTPCMFCWKATEDHLYFAAPTAEEVKRQTQKQVIVPPIRPPLGPEEQGWAQAVAKSYVGPERAEAENVQYATAIEWRDQTPPPIESVGKDLAAIKAALGDRIGKGERLLEGAARVIREGDAYIAKQAERITELITDNEFPANSGEFSVDLSADAADSLGLPSYTGQRVAIVINDGRWYARLGSTLYPIGKQEPCRQPPTLGMSRVLDWAMRALRQAAKAAPVVVGAPAAVSAVDQTDALKQNAEHYAVGGPVKIDETDMAQNAAGGVA